MEADHNFETQDFIPEGVSVAAGNKKGVYSIEGETLTLDGTPFILATTLRVAFEIQRQFGNRAYMDVFKEIGSRPIEHQIKFIYTSYVQGLKGTGQTAMPLAIFQDCLLDNFSIMQIVDCIQAIIEGITKGDMDDMEFEDRKEKNVETRKKLEE